MTPKVMCVVLFFSKMSCVEGVVQRLKTYGDPDLKFDVKVTTSSLPVIFKRQGLGDFWVDY